MSQVNVEGLEEGGKEGREREKEKTCDRWERTVSSSTPFGCIWEQQVLLALSNGESIPLPFNKVSEEP